VTVDLHDPESVRLFKVLAARTDIVCENFRLGNLEQWRLGWEVLRQI
jgi:crotonobetainyl-CoA:carnitine CoA-transferase CaiB-like acyl-CoA transferase